jgi:formyl-CoA transferase
MIVEVDHPQRGRFTMLGCAIKLRDSPPVIAPAPLLGQHTDEVLHEVLGCDDATIAQLRQQAVI